MHILPSVDGEVNRQAFGTPFTTEFDQKQGIWLEVKQWWGLSHHNGVKFECFCFDQLAEFSEVSVFDQLFDEPVFLWHIGKSGFHKRG